MNIILLQDIEKVGDIHEVVTVKPGFARNYLIPRGLAITANKTNMAKLDDLKAKQDAEAQKHIDAANALAAKMEGQTLNIVAKAGTSGKIFGSVTSVQIAQQLQEQLGIEIERKNIEIPEEVKNLGTYSAVVTLHKKVVKNINFEVVEG